MTYTITELEGIKSVRAFNSYNRLLLGYKMLPLHFDKTFEQFMEFFSNLSDDDKKKIIRESISLVDLDSDDLLALLSFVKDENGIILTSQTMQKLGIKNIIEALIDVCMKIEKINVFF